MSSRLSSSFEQRIGMVEQHREVSAQHEAGASTLHEAVLETLASAVVSLEPGGVVTTFNAAAGEITGLSPESVIGRTFAEVFLAIDGAEEFTQAVLDAIYEDPLVRQRIVDAKFPSGQRSLAVSASRVRGVKGEDTGVAVVFDDISELRELQHKELTLAREVESQHARLQRAYMRLEEQNDSLKDAERQARRSQLGGAAALLFLLLVIGMSVVDLQPDAPAVPSPGLPPGDGESSVFVVSPSELTRTVSVSGQLAPRREVDVTSPMNGKIATVHVPYGVRVERDDPLLALDIGEISIDHRNAEAAHIKAIERFNETEYWGTSVEVSRARRSVSKARIDLEDARSRLEETAFLLDRGVIPASEHEAAERNLDNRRLDLEAAEQDLETIVEKGAADGRVAKLELENARARLDELSEILRLSILRAPVAGVVMRSRDQESGNSAGDELRRLAAGDSVVQGQRLLVIGDLNGLSVVGRVDEVDVVQVQPGNAARITGDAFPGLQLQAVVSQVSSQALPDSGARSVPMFEIVATVDRLTASELAGLRIGMSATLEIVAYEKPDALMVPIGAVALDNGKTSLFVLDGDETRRVPVTLGETTIDSVEVVEGLSVGDHVVLPGA